MSRAIRRRPALCRGSFVQIRTWEDLACTHVVFKDANGEYVRLSTGALYSTHRALTGRTGCILGEVGGGSYREIRMDNGETVTVPAEILTRLFAEPDPNGQVKYKPPRKNKARFKRYKGYMESNGFRRGSGALVFT